MPYRGVYVGKDSANIFGRTKGFTPQVYKMTCLLQDKYIEAGIWYLLEYNNELYGIAGNNIYKIDKETLEMTRIAVLPIAGNSGIMCLHGDYLYIFAYMPIVYVHKVDVRTWQVVASYTRYEFSVYSRSISDIEVWRDYIVLYNRYDISWMIIFNMKTGEIRVVSMPLIGSDTGGVVFADGYCYYTCYRFDYILNSAIHYIVKYDPFEDKIVKTDRIIYKSRVGEYVDYAGTKCLIRRDFRVEYACRIQYVNGKLLIFPTTGLQIRYGGYYINVGSDDEKIIVFLAFNLSFVCNYYTRIPIWRIRYNNYMCLSNKIFYRWFEITDLFGNVYYIAYDDLREMFITSERIPPIISGSMQYIFTIASSVYIDDDHIYIYREVGYGAPYRIIKYRLPKNYDSPIYRR